MYSVDDEVKRIIYQIFGENPLSELGGVITYINCGLSVYEIVKRYFDNHIYQLYSVRLMSREQGENGFQLRITETSSECFIFDCLYLDNKEKTFREWLYRNDLSKLSVKDEVVDTVAFYDNALYGNDFISEYKGLI